MGLGEESNAVILLKQCSNTMTPNGVPLYPQSSTSFNPHQRGIFLWWTGVSPQIDNMQRVKNFRVLGPKRMSLSYTFPQSSGVYVDEEKERL